MDWTRCRKDVLWALLWVAWLHTATGEETCSADDSAECVEELKSCREESSLCENGVRATVAMPNSMNNAPRTLLTSRPRFPVQVVSSDRSLLLEINRQSTPNSVNIEMRLTILDLGTEGFGVSIRTSDRIRGNRQWFTGEQIDQGEFTVDDDDDDDFLPLVKVIPQKKERASQVCCATDDDNRILRVTAKSNFSEVVLTSKSGDDILSYEKGGFDVLWDSKGSQEGSWRLAPQTEFTASDKVVYKILNRDRDNNGDDDNGRSKRQISNGLESVFQTSSKFLSFEQGFVSGLSSSSCDLPATSSPDGLKSLFTLVSLSSLGIYNYRAEIVDETGQLNSEDTAVVIFNEALGNFLAIDIDDDYNVKPINRTVEERLSRLLQEDQAIFNKSVEVLGVNLGYFQNSNPTYIQSPDKRFFTRTPFSETGDLFVLCSFHHRQNCLLLTERGLAVVSIPSVGEPALRPNFRNRTLEELRKADEELRSSGLGSLAVFSSVPLEDFCSPNPCNNGGTCRNVRDSFECSCPGGFQNQTLCGPAVPGIGRPGGPISGGVRGEGCPATYCHNNGFCSIKDGQQVCKCADGFIGPQCNVTCTASDCVRGSCSVSNITGGQVCNCHFGYVGSKCDEEDDRPKTCLPANYCENGNCSVNKIGQKDCQCFYGYSGHRCNIRIRNETACPPEFCGNGTCAVDESGQPQCFCSPGYRGPHCNISSCTGSDICHGGVCTISDGLPMCTCSPCFSGNRCQFSRSHLCECNNPCSNQTEMCVSGSSADQQPSCELNSDLKTTATEFVFAFMENDRAEWSQRRAREKNVSLDIYCTNASNRTARVSLESRALPDNHPRHIHQRREIPPKTGLRLSVDRWFMNIGTGIQRKGLELNSDLPISCYYLNKKQFSADATLLIPNDLTGTTYYGLSYGPASKKTQLLIVAIHHNTSCKIYPRQSASMRIPRSEILLNRFETYQLQQKDDLTGTRVVCSSPVSFFSGNVRTRVGSSSRRADHIVEQGIPVRLLGQEYVRAPTPLMASRQDVVRIVATRNGTTTVRYVSRAGPTSVKLTFAGDFRTVYMRTTVHNVFSGTRPFALYQVTEGNNNGPKSDPAMVQFPPVSNWASEYAFVTPAYFNKQPGSRRGPCIDQTRGESGLVDSCPRLLLVARRGEEGSILLDSSPLRSSAWSDVRDSTEREIGLGYEYEDYLTAEDRDESNDSQYVAASVNVSPGYHSVNSLSGNIKFQALTYGAGFGESYFHNLGFNAPS